jgi:hypothetical protein
MSRERGLALRKPRAAAPRSPDPPRTPSGPKQGHGGTLQRRPTSRRAPPCPRHSPHRRTPPRITSPPPRPTTPGAAPTAHSATHPASCYALLPQAASDSNTAGIEGLLSLPVCPHDHRPRASQRRRLRARAGPQVRLARAAALQRRHAADRQQVRRRAGAGQARAQCRWQTTSKKGARARLPSRLRGGWGPPARSVRPVRARARLTPLSPPGRPHGCLVGPPACGRVQWLVLRALPLPAHLANRRSPAPKRPHGCSDVFAPPLRPLWPQPLWGSMTL